MTDADGQIVWRGQFSTWGETERELSVPKWQVPQNLRFQGQYFDRVKFIGNKQFLKQINLNALM
ncbi:RHS domain-containing protein [Cronobacter sakazakii]